MNYEWVIARYDGEMGKQIAALADTGVGYFKLNEVTTGRSKEIAVAFRRAIDGARPDHLLEIRDLAKIDGLERQHKLRTGIK